MLTYINVQFEDVQEYGANAAIVLATLRLSIVQKIEERGTPGNEAYYHEGNYWMYGSLDTITRNHKNCFTKRQIQKAIEVLKEKGALNTGNYNKHGYDRTIWYSLTLKELRKLTYFKRCHDDEAFFIELQKMGIAYNKSVITCNQDVTSAKHTGYLPCNQNVTTIPKYSNNIQNNIHNTVSEDKNVLPTARRQRAPKKTNGTLLKLKFIEAYEKRYGVKPLVENVKSNAIFKRIVDQVGLEEAITLVDAYIHNNDKLYAKLRHPLDIFCKQLDKVKVDSILGRPTDIDMTNMDRDEHNNRELNKFLGRV